MAVVSILAARRQRRGAVNGNRTRLSLSDSQVPRQSASTANPVHGRQANPRRLLLHDFRITAGSAHENSVQPSGVEPESPHSEPRPVHWTMAGWYGYVDSNHGLNVRSVLSCPLNDTRTNIWLAAQGSNLKPLRSERSALPNCASGQLAGGERVERPKPASKTGGLPLTEPPVKLCGVPGPNHSSANRLPSPPQ